MSDIDYAWMLADADRAALATVWALRRWLRMPHSYR